MAEDTNTDGLIYDCERGGTGIMSAAIKNAPYTTEFLKKNDLKWEKGPQGYLNVRIPLTEGQVVLKIPDGIRAHVLKTFKLHLHIEKKFDWVAELKHPQAPKTVRLSKGKVKPEQGKIAVNESKDINRLILKEGWLFVRGIIKKTEVRKTDG